MLGPVHDRKQERLEPCRAGLGKGDQKNVVMAGLEVLLHPYGSFYTTHRKVPEALVFIHIFMRPPFFFSKVRYDLHIVSFPDFIFILSLTRFLTKAAISSHHTKLYLQASLGWSAISYPHLHCLKKKNENKQ